MQRGPGIYTLFKIFQWLFDFPGIKLTFSSMAYDSSQSDPFLLFQPHILPCPICILTFSYSKSLTDPQSSTFSPSSVPLVPKILSSHLFPSNTRYMTSRSSIIFSQKCPLLPSLSTATTLDMLIALL